MQNSTQERLADTPVDHPALTLAALKREITADADLRRAQPPLAIVRPAVSVLRESNRNIMHDDVSDAPMPDFDRMEYSIGELTYGQYREFIEVAYRAVLKRAPDPGGSLAFLERLAKGVSKSAILGELSNSAEGRRIGVRVHGLGWRYALLRAFNWPLLGYPLELLYTLLTLPMLARHQRQADAYFGARRRRGDAAERSGTLEQLNEMRAELEQLATAHNAATAAQLQAQVGDFAQRLAALEAQQAEAEIGKLRHHLTALSHDVGRAQHEAQRETAQRLAALEANIAAIDANGAIGLGALRNRLTMLDQERSQVEARVATLETGFAELPQVKAELRELDQRSSAMSKRLHEAESRLRQLDPAAHQLAQVAQLRHEVLAMKHWLFTIQSVLGKIEQEESTEQGRLGALAADIADRLAPGANDYAPLFGQLLSMLRHAGFEPGSKPLLDLDSGLGSWLDWLKAQAVTALGCEENATLANRCRDRGLDVENTSSAQVLRRSAEASAAAITALDAFEQHSLAQANEVVEQAFRVLTPGGLLLVGPVPPGADSTIRLPTPHAPGPLPAPVLEALLASKGFAIVHGQATAAQGALPITAQGGAEGVLLAKKP